MPWGPVGLLMVGLEGSPLDAVRVHWPQPAHTGPCRVSPERVQERVLPTCRPHHHLDLESQLRWKTVT